MVVWKSKPLEQVKVVVLYELQCNDLVIIYGV